MKYYRVFSHSMKAAVKMFNIFQSLIRNPFHQIGISKSNFQNNIRIIKLWNTILKMILCEMLADIFEIAEILK